MKRASMLAVLLCFALTGQVDARSHTPHTPSSGPSTSTSAKPDESQLVEHRSYTNAAGEQVHSPAHTVDNKVPQGASAKCRDGSYSFSKSHRGTCSHHGGVANWL
jgi:hypothetical protein